MRSGGVSLVNCMTLYKSAHEDMSYARLGKDTAHTWSVGVMARALRSRSLR